MHVNIGSFLRSMGMAVPALALSFFMLASAALAAEEKPAIRWVSSHWIPAWIEDGPQKGSGYAERMQRLVQSALPGFTHVERWHSLPRLMRELFERNDTCFSSGFYHWIDPETGQPFKDIIWSAPVYLFYWHGIAMLRETRARLPAGDRLYLEDVISDRSLRLGLERGRDYGPALTPLIRPHLRSPHVLLSGGESKQSADQYRLLLRRRIDYLLDYSYMLQFAERDLDQPGRFIFVPLGNHETAHGLGAIICRNSERGRALITALNEALVTLRHDPEFRSINADWFMIRGREEEYWQLWETELLSRAE